MTNQSLAERKRSLAERKRYLLEEGAIFRAEIIACRGIVRSRMTGGSLSKNLFGRFANIAYSIASKQSGLFSAARLKSLAPILVTGVSLLSKRYIRKSLIVGSVLIAGIGAVTYLSNRNNKAADEE
ncbi:hypothetical protein [Glaciimonas sp. PCH181]|uniref:hypothetical protein n=1 Tax=Glaciimonas sp. PCH181 TaxID=2133943 RepID=UPI000D3578F9|nr:hypothetical protein [Glaciimonas sp. PCH181]PUA17945.1 hypothetical protein C7W93_19040 [Glaciimonas sp. PCH181]